MPSVTPLTEITLNDGNLTTVDDIDGDLNCFKWVARPDKYGRIAAARIVIRDSKPINVWLHRIILERKLGRRLLASELTDHWDRNALNNRRANLRVANHSQNAANRRLPARNKLGLKGVTQTRNNRFRAFCAGTALGTFSTAEEAHAAYCQAALERWGEFANFGDTPNDVKEVV